MERIKTFLIVLMVMYILVLIIDCKRKDRAIVRLAEENGTISEKLKSQTVIYRDKVIYKTRIEEKIITEIKYLPPEGQAEISTNLEGNTSVKINNKGLCLSPSIAAIATLDGPKVGVQSRLLFWDRYGVGVGVNNEIRPYLFIDRRISDFISFLRNTSLGIAYDGDVGITIAVFL